jgi:hypothetical protein
LEAIKLLQQSAGSSTKVTEIVDMTETLHGTVVVYETKLKTNFGGEHIQTCERTAFFEQGTNRIAWDMINHVETDYNHMGLR